MRIEGIEDYDFIRDLDNDLAYEDALEFMHEEVIEEQVWLGLDFVYRDQEIEEPEDLVKKYF